jgi:hypothetical protein
MSATLKASRFLQIRTAPVGLADRIGSALRGAYGRRGADKAIARDAEADTRTAQGWLYGRTAPRSTDLLELMAANDQLETEILALVREIRERRKCPKVN